MKTAQEQDSADSFADQSEESDNPFTIFFRERAQKLKALEE
jgi:hypothetical protein